MPCPLFEREAIEAEIGRVRSLGVEALRAQAHWHHFHYRIGELIGLDRWQANIDRTQPFPEPLA